MSELKGLIIDSPHIERILSGTKTWEMRSSKTVQRGLIALIRKGSGQIIGVAEVTGTVGPMSIDELIKHNEFHQIGLDRIPAVANKWNCAWTLKNAYALPEPVDYAHPRGAVIWVKLASSVVDKIMAQLPSEKCVDKYSDGMDLSL